MKSHEQLLDDMCAAMADAWLAACDWRAVAPDLETSWRLANPCMVIDVQEHRKLFGPATGEECRLFVHRAAARDALVAIRGLTPGPLLACPCTDIGRS